MVYHLCSRVAMVIGVDGVEAVGQHADGVVADGECLPVGTDVYAVGQSADDEHVGTQLLQACDEAPGQVLAVGCGAARADDADDALLVEAGVALIINKYGRIGAFAQSGGVVLVGQCQGLDAVFRDKLHLRGRPFQGFVPVSQCLDKSRRTVLGEAADVGTVLVDSLAAARLTVELQCYLLVEARHAGQRYAVIYLVVRTHVPMNSILNLIAREEPGKGTVVVLALAEAPVNKTYQFDLATEAEQVVGSAENVVVEHVFNAFLGES